MSSTDRAAELRAQAEQLDKLAELEHAAASAKTAYAADPSEANRSAHRAAQDALREARWTARGGEGTYADHLGARKGEQ